MPKAIDISGQRFWRLVALRPQRNDRGSLVWLFQCDCGKLTTSAATYVRRGDKKSCGCLFAEGAKYFSRTHGMCYRSEYNIWLGVRARCMNPKSARYADYGGRGIRVCERWGNFENFVEDMGERPKGYSLDRIDNDGDYCPGNCRWATRKQQANNTRANKVLQYAGQAMTEAEWARRMGIKRSTLQYRLNAGWPLGKALGLDASPECDRYRKNPSESSARAAAEGKTDADR